MLTECPGRNTEKWPLRICCLRQPKIVGPNHFVDFFIASSSLIHIPLLDFFPRLVNSEIKHLRIGILNWSNPGLFGFFHSRKLMIDLYLSRTLSL